MRIPLLVLAYCLVVPLAAAVFLQLDKSHQRVDVELLNVSFDPTRELWRSINQAFAADYASRTGLQVYIAQSHGGSASQARAVMNGLQADVVTLGWWNDTDILRRTGQIASDWQERLPNHSVPYFSTIVFVVRKGNPKHIHDWPDLKRADIDVVTTNPMTSANGKLAFLAAWGSVLVRGGSEAEAQAFVEAVYYRIKHLDTGSRGATTTFAQNEQGDVHITWENEADLEVRESGGELEVIYPKVSIRAEPPVAVVDSVVNEKGTRMVADEYLKFLYRPEAQEMIAKHYFRPILPEVLEKHRNRFPEIEMFGVTRVARDWAEAQERFFSSQGVYPRIQAQRNRGQ